MVMDSTNKVLLAMEIKMINDKTRFYIYLTQRFPNRNDYEEMSYFMRYAQYVQRMRNILKAQNGD